MNPSDLSDCVDKYQNLFVKNSNCSKYEEDMLLFLAENLTRELELNKESESVVYKKIDLLLQNENSNLIKIFAGTTEKSKTLKEKNKQMKSYIDKLNTTVTLELEIQKNQHTDQIKEQQKILNLEITNLKNEMESDKIVFETREKELVNGIELDKAAVSLQCDEVESNLRKQLVDVSSKLGQSQNVIRQLNCENNNLKQYLENQNRMDSSRDTFLYFNESPIRTIKNAVINNLTSRELPHIAKKPINLYAAEDFNNTVRFQNNLPRDTPDMKISEYEANTFRKQIDIHQFQTNQNVPKPVEMESTRSTPINNIQINKELLFDKKPLPKSNYVTNVSFEPYMTSNSKIIVENDNKHNKPYRGNKWRGGKMKCTPALMPCTSTNKSNTKVVNRKTRKLYNPEDNENLLHLNE